MAGPANIGKPVIQPPTHTGAGASGGKTGKGTNVSPNVAGVPPALVGYLSGGSLPPAALWAAAKALASAQTQGPYNELGRQININNQQTQNALGQTTRGFGLLGDQMQQSVGDEQQIAGQGAQALQGIGQNTQNQLGQITSGAQAALQKYTPPSEPGLADPGQQALIAEGARQQGLAAQYSGAAQSAGGLMGQNYQGLAASNLGTGAAFGEQALANIAQAGQLKNEPLTAKQATLRQQYGADVVQALGNLRQQGINNAIAAQGLGLKASEFNATLKNDALNRAQALEVAKLAQKGEWKRAMAIINGENNRALLAQQGENQRNQASIQARTRIAQIAAAARAASAGKNRPLTPNESNSITLGIKTAESLLRNPQYKGMSPSQLDELLTTGSLPGVKDPNTGKTFTLHAPKIPGGGIGPIAQAAHDLVTQGYLSQATIRALNALNYHPHQSGFPIQNSPGVQVGNAGGGIAAPGGSIF